MKIASITLFVIVLAGCAGLPEPQGDKTNSSKQTDSVPLHGPTVPLELHWFRNSAERRALDEETYIQAQEAVGALAQSYRPNTWAVVLDIDETILDNSEYQKRLAASGQGFSLEGWAAWVQEEKATAIPGAAGFVHAVRATLHGRVVLVTNRSLADCPATETNLQNQTIEYDAILCAPDGPDGKPISDKNPRFAIVKAGGIQALGALTVLAYVGDNIQDFPGLSQASPGDPSHFGKDYFVLPNPMYGSWVGNAYK